MDLRYNDIYLKGKEEESKRWIIKIRLNRYIGDLLI